MSGNGKQMCACQCHWDLSWLQFGNTRIAVTDVDGMFVVERRGNFLFIETKCLDEPLTQGQGIMLRALSHIPQMTVVVLYGEKGWPQYIRRIEGGELLAMEPTSRTEFQIRVDDWYGRANAYQQVREASHAEATKP